MYSTVFITARRQLREKEGQLLQKNIFDLGIMSHQHVRYLHEFTFKGRASRVRAECRQYYFWLIFPVISDLNIFSSS
jgi:hypothetical protein